MAAFTETGTTGIIENDYSGQRVFSAGISIRDTAFINKIIDAYGNSDTRTGDNEFEITVYSPCLVINIEKERQPEQKPKNKHRSFTLWLADHKRQRKLAGREWDYDRWW